MSSHPHTPLPQVVIYTDGACSGNPGPGAWAAILCYRNHEKHLTGYEEHTTNNRMELRAVLEALQALKCSSAVELFTDSRYVEQGINCWLSRWQAHAWRSSSGKPVLNRDLWEALAELLKRHDVRCHWVKGHADCKQNLLADLLARRTIQIAAKGK